jgi:hypothetical protein
MMLSPNLRIAKLAVVLLIAVPVVAHAGNRSVPGSLDRIEALLEQALELLTPAPVVPQDRTRLLFPFATNVAGFDSGLAISNTGLDSSGAVGVTGSCTIHYFGTVSGGGAPPAPQTSVPIAPGEQLIFTLSGGNAGAAIAGAPAFQGYIEADCEFPFGHGFGFLTDGFGGIPALATSLPVIVLPIDRTGH